jgi:hypothetical protein
MLRSMAARARLFAHQVPPPLRTAALRARWRLAGAPRGTGDRLAVPSGGTRLLVAPANFAGQGFAWSRAAMAHIPGTTGVCVEIGAGTLSMPTDKRIRPIVADGDRVWAAEQLAWVRDSFSHVLIEAGRPLFGSLFDRDVLAEVAALRDSGLSVALMAHGTDVRVPSRHAAREPWSPFSGGVLEDLALREFRARTVAAVFEAFDGPTFVSTPDLLDDVAGAVWCPVVVDLERWGVVLRAQPRRIPTVLHVPSRGPMKGSDLVDPVLHRMHEVGSIRYCRASGVAARDMPEMVQSADIVVDQFRIGSYGVAACEAMAAGRVVIGHVRAEVRQRVQKFAGHDLPIVESTPDDLATVVGNLVSDSERVAALGADGRRFVEAVHDGRASAQALRGWLSRAN